MTDLGQDLRYAARTMRHRPGFAAAAVAMLALGIGATTAIFTVVNHVLINPLPYRDAEALVRIVHVIGGIDQPYFNDAIYTTYVDNTQTLEDIGVWSPGGTATVTGRGDPEDVRALAASRGVLTTLGVQPEIGRWFSTAEDTAGQPDVVMLTHGYWQRRFGGDRGVLDRSLTVNARPHQIVGVMPAGFRVIDDFDIILPLRIDRGRLIGGFRLVGVARLKSGVTLAQANADSARILRTWLVNDGRTDPAFQARYQPALVPLKQDVVGDIGETLWVLMAAIGLVLLMACANVATLLLVRADARRRELAIRAAMGAGRVRVARQLLVESLALAVLAGAIGTVLAYAALRALVSIAPADIPRLAEVELDPAALAFATVISLMSGVLFGLFPVLRYSRPRLTDMAGRAASTTHERQRSQQVLVTAQVALAVVLLVGAGLMVRTFQALRHVDPGFRDPASVQTFTVSMPSSLVPEPERVTRMQQDLLERLADIPGVVSASFMTRLPMGADRSSSALTVEGRPDDGRTPPNRHVKIVSPGVFATLRTPLLAGRDFTWTDLYEKREIAIVSANLARELWTEPAAALGKRVREYYAPSSPWREIVGVVGDVYDDGADREPPATIYWPAQPVELFLSGYGARRASFAMRTDRGGTETLRMQVHEAVRSVGADLPIAEMRTLDEVFDESLARSSFTLVLLALAGAMAVLLGVSGLYGVIAYAVSQRRREIGIRLALGAQAREVRTLFVRRGLVVASIGVALGIAAALGFTQLMESLLFGTSPLDPITFAAVPVVLAAATALASYLPARHASSVDPVETLKAE